MENTSNIKIFSYVSSWSDKYFHHSSFDMPVQLPSKKVLKFFSQFIPNKPVKLYRGINKYNFDTKYVTSWTYEKEIAKRYITEGGKIIERIFKPKEILLDTTLLNKNLKILLGYDYKIDDREVLIMTK